MISKQLSRTLAWGTLALLIGVPSAEVLLKGPRGPETRPTEFEGFAEATNPTAESVEAAAVTQPATDEPAPEVPASTGPAEPPEPAPVAEKSVEAATAGGFVLAEPAPPTDDPLSKSSKIGEPVILLPPVDEVGIVGKVPQPASLPPAPASHAQVVDLTRPDTSSAATSDPGLADPVVIDNPAPSRATIVDKRPEPKISAAPPNDDASDSEFYQHWLAEQDGQVDPEEFLGPYPPRRGSGVRLDLLQ